MIHVDLNPTISTDLTPGADMIWDFTDLQNDESNFACYPPSDDLEFIDEFPLSETYTYGPGYIYAGPGGTAPINNWGYLMTFTNSQGLFAEGFYSDYGMGYRSTYNTPPELLMFTPANYLDEEVNISYWEVVINETVEAPYNVDTLYRRDVSKTLNCDAWGELTTDYGTYAVLRIHETGISIDSVFGYNGIITYFSTEVSRDTINNYYFWAKELRNPLMTLHCDYEDNIERIDYLMGAIYADKSELHFTDDLYIYPNPAQDIITVQGLLGKYSIFDIAGKFLIEGRFENNYQIIDISTLQCGYYFIQDENGSILKFVKN